MLSLLEVGSVCTHHCATVCDVDICTAKINGLSGIFKNNVNADDINQLDSDNSQIQIIQQLGTILVVAGKTDSYIDGHTSQYNAGTAHKHIQCLQTVKNSIDKFRSTIVYFACKKVNAVYSIQNRTGKQGKIDQELIPAHTQCRSLVQGSSRLILRLLGSLISGLLILRLLILGLLVLGLLVLGLLILGLLVLGLLVLGLLVLGLLILGLLILGLLILGLLILGLLVLGLLILRLLVSLRSRQHRIASRTETNAVVHCCATFRTNHRGLSPFFFGFHLRVIIYAISIKCKAF